MQGAHVERCADNVNKTMRLDQTATRIARRKFYLLIFVKVFIVESGPIAQCIAKLCHQLYQDMQRG